ncbi:MAG: DUF1778 domain-containing protein [Oceanicaulis sp.]
MTAPAHPSATKTSINLRLDERSRRLIDAAAETLGKTRTEFMTETARRAAEEVLLDQRLLTLEGEAFGAFLSALETPPPADEKLKALMGRTPAWRR